MKHYFIRILIYVLGLYLTALGIVLTTQCQLGVAAVACLASSIASTFSLSLGSVLTILYCGFVGVEYILLRKEFKYTHFLQVFSALLFGCFTDGISAYLQLTPILFVEQFTLLWLGLLICAFGVVLTIQMHLVPCAPDGLVEVIAIKYETTFGRVKVKFDVVCVLVALCISYMSTQSFGEFGLTTCISMFCLGSVIGYMECKLQPLLHTIISYK